MNINTVHVCGNLTRDPESKAVGQSTVCKFSIAINRTWKDANGEKKEEVTFVDCEAWGKTAELIGQYLTKGSECYVQGRLKLDQWDDKDGQKRSRLKVVAEAVQFGRKPQGDGGERPARAATPAPTRAAAAPPAYGDDAPPF